MLYAKLIDDLTSSLSALEQLFTKDLITEKTKTI